MSKGNRPGSFVPCLAAGITWLAAGAAPLAFAQVSLAPVSSEWRGAGSLVLDRGLPGNASGPVSRVWYSPDGAKIFALGIGGRIHETADFEQWSPSGLAAAPVVAEGFSRTKPEEGAMVRRSLRERVYAAGRYVYRSDDDGANWTNLTNYRNQSILGGAILDLAASPVNADEVTVATENGLFRTVDAGLTWSGVNDGLPNFPASRILGLPNGVRGMRIEAGGAVFEWQPGERKAWRESPGDATLRGEAERNARLTQQLGTKIATSAAQGEAIYAGAADGRLFASSDRGVTWRAFRLAEMGPVTRIAIDPQDTRIALAATGERPRELDPARRGAHVLRTINGGGFWDDLTSDLPDVAVNGVAFERSSGAVYVATARGVFLTVADLNGLGPATPWRRLAAQPALDVELTVSGHQIYAILEGQGVYATAAPHRRGSPRLVSAADFGRGQNAAPGSLLTVLGSEVRRAQAGSASFPVLASGRERSEIQVPFDIPAQGSALTLAVEPGDGAPALRFGLSLEATAPAIFIDRDGAPMLLDAESGVMLDGLTPARGGNRVQILAAGLGRVRPEWPAGVAAPMDRPPAVVARVRAWLDRSPVQVTRAVLAPGYIGFYLVEIELPAVLNSGPAELYIEADGRASNRVRIFVEP